MPKELPFLRILIDSREKRPIIFPHSLEGPEGTIRIEVETTSLPTGDYSIEGHAGRPGEFFGITIERKNSIEEIAANLTAERERFTREFLRMSLFQQAIVIIEAERREVEEWHVRTQMTKESFIGSLDSWSAEHRVPIHFVRDRYAMQELIFDTLRRYAEKNIFGRKRPSTPMKQAALIQNREWASHQIQMASLTRAVADILNWIKDFEAKAKDGDNDSC